MFHYLWSCYKPDDAERDRNPDGQQGLMKVRGTEHSSGGKTSLAACLYEAVGPQSRPLLTHRLSLRTDALSAGGQPLNGRPGRNREVQSRL